MPHDWLGRRVFMLFMLLALSPAIGSLAAALLFEPVEDPPSLTGAARGVFFDEAAPALCECRGRVERNVYRIDDD